MTRQTHEAGAGEEAKQIETETETERIRVCFERWGPRVCFGILEKLRETTSFTIKPKPLPNCWHYPFIDQTFTMLFL